MASPAFSRRKAAAPKRSSLNCSRPSAASSCKPTRSPPAPIAKALVEAHDRGVAITVILDKSDRTEQYSAADFVQHAGIATYIDDKHAIAHNKIMLIDGRTIITGSFNFTKQAETSNAENLLVIRDKQTLYAAYEDNFRRHIQHSVLYEGHQAAESNSGTRRRKR